MPPRTTTTIVQRQSPATITLGLPWTTANPITFTRTRWHIDHAVTEVVESYPPQNDNRTVLYSQSTRYPMLPFLGGLALGLMALVLVVAVMVRRKRWLEMRLKDYEDYVDYSDEEDCTTEDLPLRTAYREHRRNSEGSDSDDDGLSTPRQRSPTRPTMG